MNKINIANSNISGKSFSNPKIYVACLASYNSGILYGCWIDATQDVYNTQAEIKAMLADSPELNAEEYAIHDFDNFYSCNVSEFEGLDYVHRLAVFIDKYGKLGAELVNYFGSIECAENALESDYQGHYDSELDFAKDLFDECYAHEVPDSIRFYIDYKTFKRDIFINDYHSIEIDHQVYIFSNY